MRVAASRSLWRSRCLMQIPRIAHRPVAVRAGATGARVHDFYVTCHPGLENVVAQELTSLGIKEVEAGKAGVSFRSTQLADGYKANLWLRSAIRVLQLLGKGTLDTNPAAGRRGVDALYDYVRSFPAWTDVIPKGHTFSVEPRLWSCTDFNSVQVVWTTVKNAICDDLRDKRNDKPPPPEIGTIADVPLYIALYQDEVSVYRDMSGSSLHRRGYRDAMHKSPLNEAMAAGMLHMAGWPEILKNDEDAVLADPMCGSGTLLIEAGLMAANRAPGLFRHSSTTDIDSYVWPFQSWPDFDKEAWKDVFIEAVESRKPWDGRLYGNDIRLECTSLAGKDILTAGLKKNVMLSVGNCGTWVPTKQPTLVVTNPPWGRRLMPDRRSQEEFGSSEAAGSDEGTPDELRETWLSLSNFLRTQCGDSTACVISGSLEGVNYLRMKPTKKYPVTVGGVKSKVFTYKVLPPKKDGDNDADWIKDKEARGGMDKESSGGKDTPKAFVSKAARRFTRRG